MRLLLSAMIAVPFALHAGVITSATCMIATETQTSPGAGNSSCGLSFPPDAVNRVSVQAMATAGNGVLDTQGGFFGAITHAEGLIVPPVSVVTFSARAQASDSAQFYTLGPSRPGFIRFDGDVIFTGPIGANPASITDGSHRYDFLGLPGVVGALPCGPDCVIRCAITSFGGSCNTTGTDVFNLGVVFDVSASEDSSVGGNTFMFPNGVVLPDNGFVHVTFTLLEADGTTPVPLFSTVPEPSTFGLLLFGLACLYLVSRHNDRVARLRAAEPRQGARRATGC